MLDQQSLSDKKFSPLLYWLIKLKVFVLIGVVGISLSSISLYASPTHAPGYESWSEWISADLDYLDCAQRSKQHHCQWISQLEIRLSSEQSAVLHYVIYVGKKSLVPLVKDSRVSLSTVKLIKDTAEAQDLVLVWKNGTAWVELEAGAHQVQAHLKWNVAIDRLKIPNQIARVKVIDEKGERTWVDRDQEGAIWLNERSIMTPAEQSPQQESNVQIFRIWTDEVPLKLETHIQLNVSGTAREQVISGLQMKGAVNTHLKSSLEVDWVKEGLRVYLKPGQSTIKLMSVFPNSPQKLTVPTVKGSQVASHEVWVWHRREQLRRVKLSGLEEVDPEFTALPQSLGGGAHTWLAKPGETLFIEELQRGVKVRPPNELSVQRKLWLDLDGVGFTAQDHIGGSLNSSSRLNVLSTSTLGRASLELNQASIPLLITRDEKKQLDGVEIRSEDLSVYADFRYPNLSYKIPALDWSVPVNSLSVTLNLPPSWRLFSLGDGAYSSDDWLSSWGMRDLFFVALITIVFLKLFGYGWAALALLSLVLFHKDAYIYQELLSISVGFFLLKASLETGVFSRLVSFAFAVVFLGFVLSTMSLGQKDFRTALHPQLDRGHYYEQEYDSYRYMRTPKRDVMQKVGVKYSKGQRKYGELDLNEQLQKLDQNAVVQTGPGIPNWTCRKYEIAFDAPIEPNRSLALTLIPPFWTRLAFLLRSVSLLGILVMLLVKLKALPWKRLTTEKQKSKSDTKQQLQVNLILFVFSLVIIPVQLLHADELQPPPIPTPKVQLEIQDGTVVNDQNIVSHPPSTGQKAKQLGVSNQQNTARHEIQPSPQLVSEWKDRLKKAKTCQGECIYVGDMNLSFDHEQATIKVVIHAEKDSLFVLPGTSEVIHWEEAKIAEELLPMRLEKRLDNGDVQQVAVRIPKGVHLMVAQGRLPERDQLSIILGDIPKTLSLNLKTWVEESNRNGKVSSLINLKRLSQSQRPQDNQSQQASLEKRFEKVGMDYSWFNVKKSLNFGPIWQIVTHIERKNSSQAEEIVLPLIKGERVLSSEHEISGEGVIVSFASGQSKASYLSELTPVTQLKLNASKARWTETWTLNCGILWRCQSSGLNPVSLGGDSSGGSQASLTWRPWPGESVMISISRPQSIKGSQITVNDFSYVFKPSTHLARGEISINLTASKGGSKELTLPKGARQIDLFVDSKQQFDPAEANRVRLPIKPGANHYRISWQQDWKRSFKEQVPLVYSDLQGVNINQRFTVGHRWLLWTNGPDWGPAILMWGKIVFALILAFILAWRPWSPLKTWHWFLLLAGLAQHHPVLWVGSILWFVAFSIRMHYWHRVKSRFLFNLGQLTLVGGTLLFLLVFAQIIERNLLSYIDMQVSGNRSTSESLRWYIDRLDFTQGSALIEVYSLPIWLWRALMLLWALWFAAQLFTWLKWAWKALTYKQGWQSLIIDNESE